MTTVSGYLGLVVSLATPTADDRTAASAHRQDIDECLSDDLGIYRLFETGSWSHGTAVTPWSDVDYFASMPGVRKSTSREDLVAVRDSLADRFPESAVWIDRPSVKVMFSTGPDVEVTPAHITSDDDYYIPDPNGIGWIKSSPLKHKEYVNAAREDVPDVKTFIRLVKEWSYQRDSEIASLYLEMRAAQHVLANKPYVPIYDLAWFFRALDANKLADMNDPSRFDGRRLTAGPSSKRETALKAIDIAAQASKLALDCYKADRQDLAVKALEILFSS